MAKLPIPRLMADKVQVTWLHYANDTGRRQRYAFDLRHKHTILSLFDLAMSSDLKDESNVPFDNWIQKADEHKELQA